MKNIKIAVLALTAALAVAPSAFGASIPFTLTETDGGFKFTLTGNYTTSGGINTIVGGASSTFTQTGTGDGNTSSDYIVLGTQHTPEMGAGIMNDNQYYTGAQVPFDVSGLLIKLTDGTLAGDYLYVNGIGALDSAQVDVTIFKNLTGSPSSSVVASVNYYLPDLTKTPEPSSMLLLGTGLLSLAGLVFWKSKSSGSSLPALTL